MARLWRDFLKRNRQAAALTDTSQPAWSVPVSSFIMKNLIAFRFVLPATEMKKHKVVKKMDTYITGQSSTRGL
jgi:hypothetical protein